MTENLDNARSESVPEERHELERVRIEKIQALRDMGVNPYPYDWKVDSEAANNKKGRT